MKTIAYLKFTFINVIIYTIIFVVALWFYIKWKNRRFEKLASQLRGPKAYPIIGMVHEFIGGTNEGKELS